MTMMTAMPHSSADTRRRLLEAAGEVFAEQGFRQATVRDICARAGANVAAVNYHFRDKLGLYTAALQHWMGAAMDKYPPDGGLPPDAPAEWRLRAFVRSFCFRLLDQGVPAWHGRLMAREMADPTPGAIDALVESHMRPQAQGLFGLIRILLGPEAPEERVRFFAFSVVGQCLFYRHCQHVIGRLEPNQTFGPDDIERIADHITHVILSAAEAYRKPADEKPAVRAKTRRVREKLGPVRANGKERRP
jgi:TetR/AcrR family transcriptional regulator, regulator of cefoperazone and chloramphenicol sensitivity